MWTGPYIPGWQTGSRYASWELREGESRLDRLARADPVRYEEVWHQHGARWGLVPFKLGPGCVGENRHSCSLSCANSFTAALHCEHTRGSSVSLSSHSLQRTTCWGGSHAEGTRLTPPSALSSTHLSEESFMLFCCVISISWKWSKTLWTAGLFLTVDVILHCSLFISGSWVVLYSEGRFIMRLLKLVAHFLQQTHSHMTNAVSEHILQKFIWSVPCFLLCLSTALCYLCWLQLQ